MVKLTVQTIDHVIEEIYLGRSRKLDLSKVRFIDPYALLLLDLCLHQCREEDREVSVVWPKDRAVCGWLRAMGFLDEVTSKQERQSRSTSTLQPITRIGQEEGIRDLVDGFDQRLMDRYPLTTSSRNGLVGIMLELFQNIPQHSNATGEIADPRGLAAMQDYPDYIMLAVADKGIGLSKSLSLRREFANLRDATALDQIVFTGISRFSDPGRGGELQRIARLVHGWDGSLTIRSGEAVLYMDAERGDIYEAPEFPGAQIGIQVSQHVFGIEAPPVDNG